MTKMKDFFNLKNSETEKLKINLNISASQQLKT